MNMHIYEVVKQYVFFVEEASLTVKGRISRSLDPNSLKPFHWEISHHWKPSQAAGTYYPSATSGDTVENTEALLFAYAKAFTNIDIKPNESY